MAIILAVLLCGALFGILYLLGENENLKRKVSALEVGKTWLENELRKANEIIMDREEQLMCLKKQHQNQV